MAEKIKKQKDVVFVLGIGLVLTIAVIAGMSGMIAMPNFASAATSTTVTVTATVESWLTISAAPSSVTLTPSLVDIAGGINVGSSTSNVAISVGTNSATGWSIGIKGAGAGLVYGSTSTINSVTGTSTLTAGNDGYGANASTTLVGTTIGALYNNWSTTTVGEIKSGAGQTLASKPSLQASTTVATMKVYAAATSTHPSGSYADTITLTVTAIP